MANQTAIILNNTGNDIYAQTAREYLTSPINVIVMRILLNNVSQLNNVLKIRNSKSVGTQSNRDISLYQFINAMDKTNMIVDIKLDPPLILDGNTSFQIAIEGNTEIYLLFYFNQADRGNLLQ